MTTGGTGAPRLVLGPLLRYVGETAVTIWVETDRACRVEILGHQARTFEVAGHHYGLVVADGLRPGTEAEYQVALDGVVRWPEPDSPFPPSVLRTLAPGRPLRIVFGSCRIAELPVRSRGRARARHEQEHGTDALRACALDLRDTPRQRWPDVLLMIGDQVYGDEPGPATREFIEQRRDPADPPGYQVADFAEYCVLYHEAWSEPAIRWLLSVIPTAMIFDDHDVIDDWNTSAAWRREYQAKPWWRERITGAFVSYWIYQHLGNLSPEDLGRSELWRQAREAGDAAGVLREFALRADQGAGGGPWSYSRSFGKVRVVVIDSRAGRVLTEGRRLMLGEPEWQRITEALSGDWDHVVLATSLPLLLPRGVHDLEAWNEAVCGGAWGRRLARAGERLRQAADLEHWAAFGESFGQFERLLTGLATGARGRPPGSVTVVSGDIHHSYLAPVEFPAGTDPRSAVSQAVCSPFHNLLPDRLRRSQLLATSLAGRLGGTALARLAGVRKPQLRWRIGQGPWFQNMLCTLEFRGRGARIRFERTAPDQAQVPRLRPVCDTELS
ncbi:MAG: alkaline phosphatase family protein [Actinobacteria bacterium]|nr:alkaline phosphatase family protein [Actinomycetota bacterium]